RAPGAAGLLHNRDREPYRRAYHRGQTVRCAPLLHRSAEMPKLACQTGKQILVREQVFQGLRQGGIDEGRTVFLIRGRRAVLVRSDVELTIVILAWIDCL